jgi:hypothetical protein
MSAESTIKQLKVMLGIEKADDLSLELADQTVFATKFSEGEKVYFKKDEDQVPLPKGQYTTKDGKQLLSVDDEGVFVSLQEVEEEEEEEESPKAEYLTHDQAKEQFVSKEEFAALLEIVESLQQGNTEMASENKSLKENLSKVEGKLEITKQLLSKIETPKVTHSPEPKQPAKSEGLSGAAVPLSSSQRNIFRQFNA